MKLKMLLILCVIMAFALSLPAQDNSSESKVLIKFDYKKKWGMASNQFAVWVEDKNGNLIKTLYVTKFTANGGYKKRPDSLPEWAGSKPEKNIDAVTYATPKTSTINCIWDFTDSNGKQVSLDKEYVLFIEGIVHWKDNVLYRGVIDSKSPGAIKINTTYSTDKAKKNSIINNVSATSHIK